MGGAAWALGAGGAWSPSTRLHSAESDTLSSLHWRGLYRLYRAIMQVIKEVHAGDALYSTLEIIDLARERENGIVTTGVTVFNQKGELVLSGWHKYLLKAG